MKPGGLRRLAFRFREARAIFAAVEIGLFEALGSGAGTPSELCERLGCDVRGLRILLDALASMHVLERDGEAYRLAPDLVGTLVPGGSDYVGNLFLHDLWHWASWTRLGDVVRQGRPGGSREGHLTDPEVLRRFLPNYNLAMEQSTGESAIRFVERVARFEPRSVLDLGGGGGTMILSLLDRLPESRGILAEHPFALDRARENVVGHPAGERLELLALDFEKQTIPSGHDAILLSRVLMGMDPGRAERLVRAAAAALAPGGLLAIHDFAAESRVGALLSLDMLLNTGGEVHSPEEISRWLRSCDLALKESGKLTPYTLFWIGRKGS